MDDFFWWVESLARSLEYEDRARMSRAMEFTGASRRQERLEHQRNVTQEIGQEHESAAGEGGPGSACSQDYGHEPHEHGGADKQYSKNGERCDFPTCQYNYKKTCDGCKGTGYRPGYENQPVTAESTCGDCNGAGKVPDESLTTPPHSHPEPAKPYQDQAKVVHDFGDGWSIKKTHTFGDLKYEGQMMTNCIQDDADGGTECETCYGSGHCSNCEEGSNTCGECDGAYEQECSYCEGAGSEDCQKCETTSTEEDCHGCGGKGEQDGKNCGVCNGRGKRTVWHPGKQECSSCDGEGTDEDGDECYHCDGTKLEDCDDCGGEGKFECQNCEGVGHTTCDSCEEGYNQCWECEGGDTCGTCDGEGTQGSGEGGPENYYRPYDDHDAKNFNRAPGGAYSLRDPDNVPHVSFLHGEQGDDPNHIHDVLGRENKHPKPEYQKKMMQYMRAKLPGGDDPQLPGTEAKCGTCQGEKTQTEMVSSACGKCGGGRREDCGTCNATGRVPDDDPGREQGHTMEGDPIPNLKACDDCSGVGKKPCGDCFGRGTTYEGKKVACRGCKGTGEPTVKIDWGYRAKMVHHTGQELDDMINGTVPKPDVMLLGKHKTNPNEVKTFRNAEHARLEGETMQYVKTPCASCNSTGFHMGDQASGMTCGSCRGNKYISDRRKTSDIFDLHAVPTNMVGADRMEFDAVDHDGWKVKDGKGAKVNWDGGTKLDWKQVNRTAGEGVSDDTMADGFSHADEHRELRQGQPDYVHEVLPRVAKNRFGARCGHKLCAKAWGPGHPGYDAADWDNEDADNEGKYRFSTHPGHNEWDEDAIAEWSFDDKGQDWEDPSVPKFNCTHCGMIVPGPADASECPNCDQPWDDKDVAKCSVHGDSLWDHNTFPQRCNIGESLSSGGTLPDDKIISCPNKREPTAEDHAALAKYKSKLPEDLQDMEAYTDGHGLVHEGFEKGLQAQVRAKGEFVDNPEGCNTCGGKGWLRDPSNPPIPKEWMQGCRFDDEDLSEAAKFTKGQGELRIPQTVEKQPARVRNNPEMS